MLKTDISKNQLYIKKLINVIKAKNNHINKPLHTNGRHSDAFVYILAGSCTYEFDDGNTFTVHTGDILYLAHHAVYTMRIHTENYNFIFCDFEFDGCEERKSDVYSPHNSSDCENLFFKLVKHYQNLPYNSFSECMAILYKIYGMIMTDVNNTYIGNAAKSKMEEAKMYINTNYNNTSLSVSLLSEKAGMSEVYFRKLFKEQYHISPSQYITSVRLKKAKEFMKYPFLTLEDCALQSGFSSLQYFCRVFKQETGITPGKYRR